MTSRQVEALKWLGLVAMLIEHLWRYVWPSGDVLWFAIGRQAFPLYAVALALTLAPDSWRRGYQLAVGLLPFAVAAQFFVHPLRDDGALNVLFLFLAVGAWLGSADASVRGRYVVRGLALLAALLSEFWWPGFALVLCLVRLFESMGTKSGHFVRSYFWLAGVAWALVGISVSEGSWWGFASLGVFVLVLWCHVEVPRIPGLFAWLYVLQFPLYHVLRWL